MGVMVTVQKPALPTLWLDSSVLIGLAKLLTGERKEPRLEKLRSSLVSLVSDGKLAVVEGEQDDEYAVKRLEWEIAAEQARLSCGVRLKSRFQIVHELTLRGMDAFVRGEGELQLGWEDFFERDPRTVLQERRNDRVIAVSSPGTPVTPDIRELRTEKVEAFEGLRQSQRAARVTYEEQLAQELSSEAESWCRNLQGFADGIRSGCGPGMWNMPGMQSLFEYREHWNGLDGIPAGFRGVLGYFDSDVHKALPPVRITAQLWADILTGNEALKSGDPGDVEMLSVVLPACSLVLSDNRQRLRLERRGIAVPWGARVFSMQTIDSLFEVLDAL